MRSRESEWSAPKRCAPHSLSSEGLYLNLRSLRAYGAKFLELDHGKTGATLYLHLMYTKVRSDSLGALRSALTLTVALRGPVHAGVVRGYGTIVAVM